MPRDWIDGVPDGTEADSSVESLKITHVAVSVDQEFTEDEKKTARDNIGATSGEDFQEHTNDKENPHEVTAGQTGAYTKEETDQKIASAVSGVGTFLGTLSPAEINAIASPRVGDYADVTESGYLNGGTTAVIRGDCVVYDGTEWVKRLNDGKGLFVISGQLRFG